MGETMSAALRAAPPPAALSEEALKEAERARAAAARLRAEMKRTIRELWARPEFQIVADALSKVAEDSGYATEVENIMQSVAGQLREAARATNIGRLYKWVWGKK